MFPKENPHYIVIVNNIIVINDGVSGISPELKDLCAKGPSFNPMPLNYDWLELQKDFDAFCNRLRAYYIFANVPKKETNSVNALPPPRKKNGASGKTF